MKTYLAMPTIHLNGSNRDTLMEGYIATLDTLRHALEALQAAAPNARDYVKAEGTFCMAQNQHFTRLARLRETLDEMNTIAEHASTLV